MLQQCRALHVGDSSVLQPLLAQSLSFATRALECFDSLVCYLCYSSIGMPKSRKRGVPRASSLPAGFVRPSWGPRPGMPGTPYPQPGMPVMPGMPYPQQQPQMTMLMPGTDVASYQQAGLHTPAAIQDVGPGDGDDNDDESALDNSGSSSSSDSDDGKKLCQIELLKIC